jgi:hypothetical protein
MTKQPTTTSERGGVFPVSLLYSLFFVTEEYDKTFPELYLDRRKNSFRAGTGDCRVIRFRAERLRVQRIDPGKGVEVRDILRPGVHLVHALPRRRSANGISLRRPHRDPRLPVLGACPSRSYPRSFGGSSRSTSRDYNRRGRTTETSAITERAWRRSVPSSKMQCQCRAAREAADHEGDKSTLTCFLQGGRLQRVSRHHRAVPLFAPRSRATRRDPACEVLRFYCFSGRERKGLSKAPRRPFLKRYSLVPSARRLIRAETLRAIRTGCSGRPSSTGQNHHKTSSCGRSGRTGKNPPASRWGIDRLEATSRPFENWIDERSRPFGNITRGRP